MSKTVNDRSSNRWRSQPSERADGPEEVEVVELRPAGRLGPRLRPTSRSAPLGQRQQQPQVRRPVGQCPGPDLRPVPLRDLARARRAGAADRLRQPARPPWPGTGPAPPAHVELAVSAGGARSSVTGPEVGVLQACPPRSARPCARRRARRRAATAPSATAGAPQAMPARVSSAADQCHQVVSGDVGHRPVLGARRGARGEVVEAAAQARRPRPARSRGTGGVSSGVRSGKSRTLSAAARMLPSDARVDSVRLRSTRSRSSPARTSRVRSSSTSTNPARVGPSRRVGHQRDPHPDQPAVVQRGRGVGCLRAREVSRPVACAKSPRSTTPNTDRPRPIGASPNRARAASL